MHNAERRKQQFPSGMRMTELLAKVFVKNLVRVATNSRPEANRNCSMEDFSGSSVRFPQYADWQRDVGSLAGKRL